VRPHLASLVDDFRRRPRDIAVVAHRGNRRYRTSYAELAQLTGRVSAELIRQQIAPGDRVVLWGANSAEWIACFFACLLRGVIAVPLDAAGSPTFTGRVIADTTPKLIFGDPDLLHSVPLGEAPTRQLVLSNLAQALPVDPDFTVDPSVNLDTPFQIIFTSGTTSEPKGIVHTHRNVLASLQPIENEMRKYLKYERPFHPLRFLHSLPLSHVFGQFMGLWIPPLLGAEVHFSDQLDPTRIIALLRRERISVLIAVPRVLDLLRIHLLTHFPALASQLVQSRGLSIYRRWWFFRKIHRALGWKLWAVISGGATLPADLEAFWNTLGLALIQGYGMTETAALVTLNHPFKIGRGTIGRTLPGREVRISDEGEILVRGDMLAQSTWQAGAMRARDGEWLATGDLAAADASGELRFLGRKGDVIVTAAGMNIHPADLEAALTAQPGIRGAVVVPCEGANGPEAVAVVLFAGNEFELEAAVAAANTDLAPYQRLRRVLRWPELQLPYTSTGKLLRRKVVEWACAQIGRTGDASASPSDDFLLQMLAEITGEPIPFSLRLASPTSHSSDALRLSEDLHFDSLGRVQLQSALEERLGFELDDDRFTTVQTVGDLRALLSAQPFPESTASDALPTEQSFADRPASANAAKLAETSPDSTSPNLQVALASRYPKPSGLGLSAAKTSRALAPGEQHAYPHWPWSTPIRWLRIAFVELAMRPLVWFFGAPRVTGQLPSDTAGPLLIIANHVTAYDGALILYALPRPLRDRVAAAMSGEMLLDLRRGRNQANALVNLVAPIGYLLVTALFNVFPLPRLRGFRASFAHAGEAMDSGQSVLIFPEGTRSKDGQLRAFRPGIGLLAQESQVPVLPIALIGLGELKARGKGWFRSGRLEVRVGQPIPFSRDSADPNVLTQVYEQALRELLR
jgi:long-chain acyl-CoA synthetase